MFYSPEKYMLPTRRRETKRIQVRDSIGSKSKIEKFPNILEKRRENGHQFIRDTLKVEDINGMKGKKYYKAKIKDIMNLHRVRGSEPKFTKPKRYAENNSFDYSDVNVSRRVIRKMVNSSLFDHKPLEKAKFLDKVKLGNHLLSTIDPIQVPNKNPIYNEIRRQHSEIKQNEKSQALRHSVNMRDMGSFSRHDRLNKTIDYDAPNSRYSTKNVSQPKFSLYSNHLRSNSSVSPVGTKSMKEFNAVAPFAGKPSKHDAFDINANPYHKIQNDVLKHMNVANEKILSESNKGIGALISKTRHYRSNLNLTANPYSNTGL